TEISGAGQRPRRKYPLFVEHPVVRQIDLEANRLDYASIEQTISVIELAGLDPRRADEHRRPAIGGFPRQSLGVGTARRLKRRLEHQIFGWVAGQKQFRKRNDVGAILRRLPACRARLIGVVGTIAYRRIELSDGNGEAVWRTGIHGNGR